MYNTRNLVSCLTDRAGFSQQFHNELFPLLRTADLRAFHLKRAINYFDAAIADIERIYHLKPEDVIKDASE